MSESDASRTSRRDFLTRVVPGCALSCFGVCHLRAASVVAATPSGEVHKFQERLGRQITHEQWMHRQHDRYIGILKRVGEEIGRERLESALKQASYEENVAYGRRLSARIQSLDAFAAPFRGEESDFAHTFVREIVEDTETAFEIRITECLTAQVFAESDATDLGYACVCHADFGLPVGISPRLKLIRTKTLMQGHDCCNHRYVWEA